MNVILRNNARSSQLNLLSQRFIEHVITVEPMNNQTLFSPFAYMIRRYFRMFTAFFCGNSLVSSQ